jgi:hypothetical protein
MPKAKWGAITATDIESAESNYTTYEGEIPPRGVYRFKLKQVKATESSNNNPMLKVLLILDGSWKPAHKEFDGCPSWLNVVVMDSTAFQVRAFCDAIGVSAADFLKRTVLDDDDKVIKIGKVSLADGDLLVKANCKPGEYEGNPKLESSLLPLAEETEEEDEDEEDTEEEDEEGDGDAPF